MNTYCQNCGAVVGEGYSACPNCGAPVANNAVVNNYNLPAPKAEVNTEKTTRFIVIGVAVLVAVIAVVAIITGIVANGYKKPIKQIAKAYETCDAEIMFDAMSPMIDNFDSYEDGAVVDSMEVFFEDEAEFLEDECGKGYKVNIKYGEAEKYTDDEIADFVEEMEEEYSFEYDADDFSKLYEVDVEMTAEGEDGKEEFEDSTYFVAKIDGEWLVVWIED